MTWKVLLLTLLLQSVVDATNPTCEACQYGVAGVGFIPHDVYCRVYIRCFESPLVGGKQGTVMCCADGLYWNQNKLTCLPGTPDRDCEEVVPDGVCPIVKVVVPPADCLLEAVDGDDTVYYEPSSNTQMPCAPGTVFSLINCTCIRGDNPPPLPCYDIVKFEFTNDFHSYSCNNFVHGTPHGNIKLEDGAACLDGDGDFMEFNYFNNFFANNPYAKTFSYAAWARQPVGAVGYGGLLCNADCHVGWSYCLGVSEDGISAGIESEYGMYDVLHSSMTQDDDKWHHYAVTYNGQTIKLYFDGGFLQQGSVYGGIANVKAASNVGVVWTGDSATDFYFRGCIDDATYFLKTLDADEVKAIYKAGRSA